VINNAGLACGVSSPSLVNAAASQHYQKFFGVGRKPVVCGWNTSIGLPKSEKKSISKRFFEYIDIYAKGEKGKKLPATERLQWLYDNDSIRLVEAWGWATKFVHSSGARVRDKDGTYYSYKINKKGWPAPTKA
jgi:hypothetical protein